MGKTYYLYLIVSRATLLLIKSIFHISALMIFFPKYNYNFPQIYIKNIIFSPSYNYTILKCKSLKRMLILFMINTKYYLWPMAVWFSTNVSLQPGLAALFLLLSVPQPHRPPFRVPNVPFFPSGSHPLYEIQEAISTSGLDQVPWIHSYRFSFLYFKTLCNNIHIIWINRVFFLIAIKCQLHSFRKHIYFVFHYIPSLQYNAFNIAEVQY